ncbi:MAG: ABC transporter substrate-binding protein [Desulfosalsimonas sp.]|uniref:MlaC/ttg2D family ABC transporter substrate-binding protein n=1 Tax=Desulfosalsimonas sp. TaxID=3073848 RepID=UPI0039706CB3
MKKSARITGWVLVLIFCLTLFAAHGRMEADSAQSLLKEKISEIIDVLDSVDLSEDDKVSRIEDIVDPVFDYELMARLSLGRRHWTGLSADEQETFTRRFVTRLKDSYFDKISMYSGDADATFEYRSVKEQNNKVHVPVEVRAGDETVDMVYKFYSARDTWKVYDVEINGVSIIRSYRSQFDQILADGTAEDLLEAVKEIQPPGENG